MKITRYWITACLVLLGTAEYSLANRVPFCSPWRIKLDFPDDPTNGKKQAIQLKLQESQECSDQGSSPQRQSVIEMTFHHGNDSILVPSECLPKGAVDLNSIIIEYDEAFSIRVTNSESSEVTAIYYIDEDFVCW